MNKKSINLDKNKRKELLAKAQEMVTFVEDACKAGHAAHEVEEGLFRKALELGHHAFEMFFSLMATVIKGNL